MGKSGAKTEDVLVRTCPGQSSHDFQYDGTIRSMRSLVSGVEMSISVGIINNNLQRALLAGLVISPFIFIFKSFATRFSFLLFD